MPTGRAHWEVLLRARAIETQAYVIASAQVSNLGNGAFLLFICDPCIRFVQDCTLEAALLSERCGCILWPLPGLGREGVISRLYGKYFLLSHDHALSNLTDFCVRCSGRAQRVCCICRTSAMLHNKLEVSISRVNRPLRFRSIPFTMTHSSRLRVSWTIKVGQHNEKRASYGHSLIVDPWGEVLADAGGEDSPCIRTAEIGAHHTHVRLQGRFMW